MAMCVCLSQIETGRMELDFGMGTSFDLSYTVLRKFGYSQKKLWHVPLWNLVLDSRLGKFHLGTLIVAMYCQHK